MRVASHSYKGLMPPVSHKYSTGDMTSATDITGTISSTCHCVITDIVISEAGNSGGLISLKEETSGTVITAVYVGGRETKVINLSQPIKLPTAGKKLQALSAASTDIKVTITYYQEVAPDNVRIPA
jgi:hypothetical protein|tara:strand:- start:128 stop:505 length:378 start_codon:yes stop_codon:yes gene_type:complete